jgi:hypothetical protein
VTRDFVFQSQSFGKTPRNEQSLPPSLCVSRSEVHNLRRVEAEPAAAIAAAAAAAGRTRSVNQSVLFFPPLQPSGISLPRLFCTGRSSALGQGPMSSWLRSAISKASEVGGVQSNVISRTVKIVAQHAGHAVAGGAKIVQERLVCGLSLIAPSLP